MTRFDDNTKEFTRTFARLLARGIEIEVRNMAKDIEKSISRTQQTAPVSKKTGRQWGRNPSAPGEPPKMVTGTLRNELDNETVVQGDEVIGRVGYRSGSPASKYAPALEYPTSRMDARPFLRPGLDRAQNDIRARLARIRREFPDR